MTTVALSIAEHSNAGLQGPIPYSSVQLIDPSTKLPIRVTWRYTEQGDKVCFVSPCILGSLGLKHEISTLSAHEGLA